MKTQERTQTHFVKKSGNAKTGPIPTTARTQTSCPKTCPFLNNGCYAENKPGRPSVFDMAQKFGTDDLAALETRIIKEVPSGSLIRWEVSGDVVNPSGSPDTRYIEMTNRVAIERPDIRHIRFTHAWRKLAPEMFAYPVNASCETPADVKQAIEHGFNVVITVPNADDPIIGQHIAGHKVIVCPEQADPKGNVTCKACGLCAKSDRVQNGRTVNRAVVAFIAHGSGTKKVIGAIARRTRKIA